MTSSAIISALDAAIAEANALGGLDYLVEAADQETLTILAFVDIPAHVRGRIVLAAPAYVQLPWRFSFRRLTAISLATLSEGAPRLQKWELPVRAAKPETLPSLSFDELTDLEAEGYVLFAFADEEAQLSAPHAFVVARGLSVHRAHQAV